MYSGPLSTRMMFGFPRHSMIWLRTTRSAGNAKAFSVEVVQDVQSSDRPAVCKLIRHDVHRPRLIRPAWHRQMTELPDRLKQSLAWDRGTELASHQKFTVSTDIDVYFCDPSSPLSADCYAIACRAMHGSAEQMKTPMACCANTSLKVPAFPATLRNSWTRSQTILITGLGIPDASA